MSHVSQCAHWFAIGGAILALVLVAAMTLLKWAGEGEGFSLLSFFPAFAYTALVVLILAIEGLIAGVIVGLLLELVDLLGIELHRLFHWMGS